MLQEKRASKIEIPKSHLLTNNCDCLVSDNIQIFSFWIVSETSPSSLVRLPADTARALGELSKRREYFAHMLW